MAGFEDQETGSLHQTWQRRTSLDQCSAGAQLPLRAGRAPRPQQSQPGGDVTALWNLQRIPVAGRDALQAPLLREASHRYLRLTARQEHWAKATNPRIRSKQTNKQINNQAEQKQEIHFTPSFRTLLLVVGFSNESAKMQAKYHSCNCGRCKQGLFLDSRRKKLPRAGLNALEQLE